LGGCIPLRCLRRLAETTSRGDRPLEGEPEGPAGKERMRECAEADEGGQLRNFRTMPGRRAANRGN
jgi:hypothetical protein